MIPVLSIFTLYIIVYNLGMYLPAKLFGVRVEKFYIWIDVWVSLFRIKIKDTEFGLGWLPIGGYITLSGMFVRENEEIYTFYFKGVSILKQLLIVIGGPLICLFIGVIIYLNQAESIITDFINITITQTVFIGCCILFFRSVSNYKRNKIEHDVDTVFQLHYFIGTFIFYLILWFSFMIYLNEVTPFFNELSEVFTGKIKFGNIQFDSGKLRSIAAFLGVWFFFFNLLPLGGLNGFTVVSVLHESLTGAKLPDKIIDKIGLISFSIIMLIYGWAAFALFF